MASYTSVSLMSTSTWQISGSAIISPSRWNPIVASNLCVIALHDHSGSAGEGASVAVSPSQFPTLDVQYIWPWFPVTNTCWVARTASDWPGLGYMATSSLGAVLEYDVYLKRKEVSGNTWSVTIIGDGGSTATLGGAISACIGGVFVGEEGQPEGKMVLDMAGTTVTSSYTAQGGVIDRSVSIFTFNHPEGIKGNGRIKLRIQTVPKPASSIGNEVRLGPMKIQWSE